MYEVDIEKFVAEGSGHKLSGELYVPAGAEEPLPIVIVSHGFSANLTYYRDICRQLAGDGIAAVAFDFYGGSYQSRSGGDMAEMSVFTELEDLEAVLSTVEDAGRFDTDRICLFGHSQGGFVSSLASFAHGDEICGLVMYAPAMYIGEVVRSKFPTYEDIRDERTGNALMSVKYSQDVYDYDIYEHMAEYEGPVIIIHGTRDEAVPISYSERAIETFPDAELITLEGATHMFNQEGIDEICKACEQLIAQVGE